LFPPDVTPEAGVPITVVFESKTAGGAAGAPIPASTGVAGVVAAAGAPTPASTVRSVEAGRAGTGATAAVPAGLLLPIVPEGTAEVSFGEITPAFAGMGTGGRADGKDVLSSSALRTETEVKITNAAAPRKEE
jgi:hypothetical protein